MAKPDLEERAGGGGESREVGVAKANSFCDDIFLTISLIKALKNAQIESNFFL